MTRSSSHSRRSLGPPHLPPVAGHSTAGRFLGLRELAVPPVWLVSSATKSARQLSTRLGPELVGKLLSLVVVFATLCAESAPALARSGAGVASRGPSQTKRVGYFDGKSYTLSVFGQPSFGYETNYQFTTIGVEGSALLGVNGGAELRWRPTSKVYLRTELGANLTMPLKDADLSQYLFELPVLFYYDFSDTFQLVLTNHIAVERDRSPPVFFDAGVTPSTGAIIFLAVYEQLKAGVAYSPIKNLRLQAGPYVRVKQVQFALNPQDGDPDYRLFDLAGSVSAKYRILDNLSARVMYDFALRVFQNIQARASNNQRTIDDLQMLRHYADIRVRFAHEYFALFAGYGFRFNSDNGGSFDYVEHHLLTGAGVFYKDLFNISAQVNFSARNYTNRTPCESSLSNNPTDNSDPTGACAAADPTANAPQNSTEALITVTVDATFNITDWLGINVQYVLEDAGASGAANLPPGTPAVEDPQGANHRVLGGVSLSL